MLPELAKPFPGSSNGWKEHPKNLLGIQNPIICDRRKQGLIPLIDDDRFYGVFAFILCSILLHKV